MRWKILNETTNLEPGKKYWVVLSSEYLAHRNEGAELKRGPPLEFVEIRHAGSSSSSSSSAAGDAKKTPRGEQRTDEDLAPGKRLRTEIGVEAAGAPHSASIAMFKEVGKPANAGIREFPINGEYVIHPWIQPEIEEIYKMWKPMTEATLEPGKKYFIVDDRTFLRKGADSLSQADTGPPLEFLRFYDEDAEARSRGITPMHATPMPKVAVFKDIDAISEKPYEESFRPSRFYVRPVTYSVGPSMVGQVMRGILGDSYAADAIAKKGYGRRKTRRMKKSRKTRRSFRRTK